jgi:hypothetical protein
MKEKTATRVYADELGIKYHHNANDATIQKLISAHFEKQPDVKIALPAHILQKDADYIPMTPEEFHEKYPNAGKGPDKRRECNRLIRCRIQNMNPAKKEWPGEFCSVGSAKLGTFKKFVPFNSSEAYHLPKIIFDVLSEKKCTIFHTEKDDRGNSVRKGRLVNEYALEVLPNLTPEERAELGRQQALQAGQQ